MRIRLRQDRQPLPLGASAAVDRLRSGLADPGAGSSDHTSEAVTTPVVASPPARAIVEPDPTGRATVVRRVAAPPTPRATGVRQASGPAGPVVAAAPSVSSEDPMPDGSAREAMADGSAREAVADDSVGEAMADGSAREAVADGSAGGSIRDGSAWGSIRDGSAWGAMADGSARAAMRDGTTGGSMPDGSDAAAADASTGEASDAGSTGSPGRRAGGGEYAWPAVAVAAGITAATAGSVVGGRGWGPGPFAAVMVAVVVAAAARPERRLTTAVSVGVLMVGFATGSPRWIAGSLATAALAAALPVLAGRVVAGAAALVGPGLVVLGLRSASGAEVGALSFTRGGASLAGAGAVIALLGAAALARRSVTAVALAACVVGICAASSMGGDAAGRFALRAGSTPVRAGLVAGLVVIGVGLAVVRPTASALGVLALAAAGSGPGVVMAADRSVLAPALVLAAAAIIAAADGRSPAVRRAFVLGVVPAASVLGAAVSGDRSPRAAMVLAGLGTWAFLAWAADRPTTTSDRVGADPLALDPADAVGAVALAALLIAPGLLVRSGSTPPGWPAAPIVAVAGALIAATWVLLVRPALDLARPSSPTG